jgi:hypothetical protein
MPPATDPQVQVPAVPFVASAHEHVEPAFTRTVTPGASVQQLDPIDIPAYGFLRHILLEVSAAGGTGGTGNADYPYNIFSQIALQDVNGANIVGPLDGYAIFLANLFGGYGYNNNLAGNAVAGFSGSVASPSPVFYLRIPVEISSRDGLGSLANQNASANYKLSLAINTIAATTSVAYTGAPTITIRGWLEAWTLPAPADSRGRPQAQIPPLLGTGQFWSARSQSVAVGSNTVSLTRVGNLLRSLVFVARDVSGNRTDTVFPDPFTFNWDGVNLYTASQRYLAVSLAEKLASLATVTRPAGVYVLPFNHGGEAGGKMGNETPDLWLPTAQSSRLEVVGTSAAAGAIQVITNEVAPVEMNQAERYQVPSDSGGLLQPTAVAA